MKKVTLCLLAALYPIASYPYTECSSEKYLLPTSSSFATSIKFVNVSEKIVRIYWINYSGKRVFYKQIPSDSVYKQLTYITHPWVVTDVNDNCIGVYYPDRQLRVINIVPYGFPNAPSDMAADPNQLTL